MKTVAVLALGLAFAGALPAQAEVFSSQGFTGESTTLNNLPGVNLDAVPGFGNQFSNCNEAQIPHYSIGGGRTTVSGTTCRLGNFSITATGSGGPRNHIDTTYGGNPPPWEQGWRP